MPITVYTKSSYTAQRQDAKNKSQSHSPRAIGEPVRVLSCPRMSACVLSLVQPFQCVSSVLVLNVRIVIISLSVVIISLSVVIISLSVVIISISVVIKINCQHQPISSNQEQLLSSAYQQSSRAIQTTGMRCLSCRVLWLYNSTLLVDRKADSLCNWTKYCLKRYNEQ